MTVMDFYRRARKRTSQGITAHLPRLRMLATGLRVAAELGVRSGASSSALLLGADRVIGVDVKETLGARDLEQIAEGRFDYRVTDSRTVVLPPCDLLFVDSLHTYAQCAAELRAHADRVARYLVFHDTVTYGRCGEDGGPGILRAIDEHLARDTQWRQRAHYLDSHGLLVLERAA